MRLRGNLSAVFAFAVSAALLSAPAVAQDGKTFSCLDRNTKASKFQVAGGTNADPSRYPFIVQVVVNGRPSCGGALVGQGWVLTAAHCVTDRIEDPGSADFVLRAEAVTVTLPDLAGRSQGPDRAASHIFAHPAFDFKAKDSDVALIRLAEPFDRSQAKPIVLSDQTLDAGFAAGGECARVAGWGMTDVLEKSNQILVKGPVTDKLQELNLSIVDRKACSEKYPGEITLQMVCAGDGVRGKNTCKGDSGGPLIVDIGGAPTLVGVVSWAYGCALEEEYSIFARVGSPKVHDWLIMVASGKAPLPQ